MSIIKSSKPIENSGEMDEFENDGGMMFILARKLDADELKALDGLEQVIQCGLRYDEAPAPHDGGILCVDEPLAGFVLQWLNGLNFRAH